MCVWCYASVHDVPSTPSTNQDSPEHERGQFLRKRHELSQRETLSAIVLYSLVIPLTAALLGFIFLPQVLLLYLASAAVVSLAVRFRLVGQITTPFLQGALSFTLLWFFTDINPLSFYMVYCHIILSTVYWHWTDMINDAHR